MKTKTIVFLLALLLTVLAGCNNAPPNEDTPQPFSFSESVQSTSESETPAGKESKEVETTPEAVQEVKPEKQEETILAVCNFSPVSYDSYRVGVPFAGKYKEIFNSDSEKFGGQGVVNARAKAAIHMECDNREFSLKLKLPAYGVTVFGCTPEKVDVKKSSVKKGNVKKTAGKSRGKRMDKAKMTVVEKSVAVKDAVKVVKRVASRRKGASGDE